MPDSPLDAASSRFANAMRRLEQAIDRRVEREAVLAEAEEAMQRMTADRGRLAGELDTALLRTERLEQTNREVSRRLVAAMETIRAVIETRKEG